MAENKKGAGKNAFLQKLKNFLPVVALAGVLALGAWITDVNAQGRRNNEESGAPKSRSERTPDSGTTRPNTGTTIPGSGTTNPNFGTTIPGSGTTNPNLGTTIPGSGTTNPNFGTTIPGSGTTNPNLGVKIPGSGTTNPNLGTTIPGSGTTNPNFGTTIPGSGTTNPNLGVKIPGSGTTNPNFGTTIPSSGTTRPNQGITMPDFGVTIPGFETTRPDSERTRPGSGTTRPNQGATRPGAETIRPNQGRPDSRAGRPSSGMSRQNTPSVLPTRRNQPNASGMAPNDRRYDTAGIRNQPQGTKPQPQPQPKPQSRISSPRNSWTNDQVRYASSLTAHNRIRYEGMYDYQRGYLAALNADQSNAYWSWSIQQQSCFWRLYQYDDYVVPFWKLEPSQQTLVLGWAPNYWSVFFGFPSARQHTVLALSRRQSAMFWNWNDYSHWDYYSSLSPAHRNIISNMTLSDQRLFWALDDNQRKRVLGLSAAQRRNLFMLPEAYFWQAMSLNDGAILSEPPANIRLALNADYGRQRSVLVNVITPVSGGVDFTQPDDEMGQWVNESPSPDITAIKEEMAAVNAAIEKLNDSIERYNAATEKLNNEKDALDERRAALEYDNSDMMEQLEIAELRISDLEQRQMDIREEAQNNAFDAADTLQKYLNIQRDSPEEITVIEEMQEKQRELERIELALMF